MKIANAQASWLKKTGTRLDAGFHLSEARHAQYAIEANGQFVSLREATQSIFLGHRFRRTYVDDRQRGYPYLTASDMTKAEPQSGTFLSRKHTYNFEQLLIQPKWILLSCSGSIGRTVFTTEEFKGQIGTHDLIRIVPNERKLPAGYLYAFLASAPGFALLTQGTYGGVIQHIEPHHIAGLHVPLLPAEIMRAIDQQVCRAGELREEAAKLLREAEARLLELLSIAPERYQQLISHTERDTAQSFSVNSQAVTGLTLRARNYSLRLQGIVEELSRHNPSTLESVLQRAPYYTGRFKRIPSRAANALELMSQSDIFSLIPQGLKISPKWVSLANQAMVKRGSILIPGVGTLGENEIFSRARFVWGYLENKVVAQHLLRIEPNQKKIDAGYLYTVLSSKLWFRILRSSVCGTSLLSYIVPMLNEMPIPRFAQAEEEAIGAKAKAAYERLTSANELGTSAIQTVETHIGQWQPS